MSVPKIFIRSAYNYDGMAVSDETAHVPVGESLTVQSQANEADINVILKNFGVTGVLPQVSMPPMYGDFENVVDFRGAQDLLIKARDSFMKLPASVRNRFDNDPALFCDFCEDRSNLTQLREWGLAVPEVSPAPSGASTVAT